MRRREICILSASMAAVGATFAQEPPQQGKIGYLHSRTIAPDHSTFKILSQAWRKLGYVDGKTALPRSAEGDLRRLPGLASELIDLGASVLIVIGVPAIMAATQVTQSTPIVGIDLGIDPVRAGLAASRRRPGGNVTGLFLDQPGIVGRWIQLLLDAVPDVERLAVLSDVGTAMDQLPVAKAIAKARGLGLVVLQVGAFGDLDEVLRGLAGTPKAGIVQLNVSSLTRAAGTDFAAATQKYQLPMIAQVRSWLFSGALMSYGPVVETYFPRAVILADKIVHGEKVGELPIEGPDHFELIINLKVASALGLTIGKSLLLRADEVIR